MNQKLVLKLSSQMLAVYLVSNVLLLFILNGGLPFFQRINSFHILGRLLVIIPICIAIYAAVGYLFIIAKHETGVEYVRKYLVTMVGFIVLVNVIVFVLAYLISMFTYDRGIWVLYSLVNPVFGNLIFESARESASIFWILTTVLPSIGLYIGANYRLKGIE